MFSQQTLLISCSNLYSRPFEPSDIRSLVRLDVVPGPWLIYRPYINPVIHRDLKEKNKGTTYSVVKRHPTSLIGVGSSTRTSFTLLGVIMYRSYWIRPKDRTNFSTLTSLKILLWGSNRQKTQCDEVIPVNGKCTPCVGHKILKTSIKRTIAR